MAICSEMSSEVAAEVRRQLDACGVVEDTLDVAAALGVPHNDVMGICNSLWAKGCVRSLQLHATCKRTRHRFRPARV